MINTLLETALNHHQRGQLVEAEALYRQILVNQPGQPDTLNMLAVLLAQIGNLLEAEQFARQALEKVPGSAVVYNTLGDIYHRQGLLEKAIQTYEQAIRLDKESIDALVNLGTAYHDQQRYEEAIGAYKKALRIDRNAADVYNNLGNSLQALGRDEEAITNFEKALKLNPSYGEACYNLALLYLKLQKPESARLLLEAALQRNPAIAKAHALLAQAYEAEQMPSKMLYHLQQAANLSPQDEGAQVRFAAACFTHDQFDYALEYYQKALALSPNTAEHYHHIGNVYDKIGQMTEAKTAYEKALSLGARPSLQLKLAKLMPKIPADCKEILSARQLFKQAMDTLENKTFYLENPVTEVGAANFYLAYQGLPFHPDHCQAGLDDKSLQQQFSRLLQKSLPRFATPLAEPAGENGKIRVGIVSRFLRKNHTIGHLMRGIVEQLDKARFEVTVFSIAEPYDTGEDETPEGIQTVYLPVSELINNCRAIAATQPHVLFYTDIGMDAVSYYLAHYRLAPTQCVTWGHPITTGIETMDYFISASAIEPAASEPDLAQRHYSEKLVMLSRLPSYYPRPPAPEQLKSKEALGFSKSDHLYACPQSVFKFHPDFDAILAGILQQDPKGKLLLLENAHPYLNECLMQRFAKTFSPEEMVRIHWLKRMPRTDFVSLMAASDVLLDPLHFGGGNTTYEGLAVGTPIITLPGETMRGRALLGAYRQMGMTDLLAGCIAETPEGYIEAAIRLARNADIRQQVQETILANNKALYEDQAFIQELEAFFTSVSK